METTTTDTAAPEQARPEYLDIELILDDPGLLATVAPMPGRSLDFGHAGGCG
ncbi:hypothetical protein ABT247_32795 [Kitasatospora sp. NPDC001539]|uniref:hypothetical protein n=1 Tax=unclassified Kitasatospora TaxID=2633591 RepID=UPI00333116F2